MVTIPEKDLRTDALRRHEDKSEQSLQKRAAQGEVRLLFWNEEQQRACGTLEGSITQDSQVVLNLAEQYNPLEPFRALTSAPTPGILVYLVVAQSRSLPVLKPPRSEKKMF